MTDEPRAVSACLVGFKGTVKGRRRADPEPGVALPRPTLRPPLGLSRRHPQGWWRFQSAIAEHTSRRKAKK